jgi:hypothetical protein
MVRLGSHQATMITSTNFRLLGQTHQANVVPVLSPVAREFNMGANESHSAAYRWMVAYLQDSSALFFWAELQCHRFQGHSLTPRISRSRNSTRRKVHLSLYSLQSSLARGGSPDMELARRLPILADDQRPSSTPLDRRLACKHSIRRPNVHSYHPRSSYEDHG